MCNRIVGHELVGSVLCGQTGRLRVGRCDTKKAVEYKEHEKLKAGQSMEGEWGWRRVKSRKGASGRVALLDRVLADIAVLRACIWSTM